MNLFSKTRLVFLVTTMFFVCVVVATADWQDPTTAPPGGNVPAPVNIGSSPQTKEGQFWSNDLFGSYNASYVQNNLDIGTSPPPGGGQDLQPRIGIGRDADTNGASWTDALNMLLKVDGKIGALAYCDQNGENCSTPPFGGGLWTDGTNGIFYNDEPVIVGADVAFDVDLGASGQGWLKVDQLIQTEGVRFSQDEKFIGTATSDGQDNLTFSIGAGGAMSSARGGRVQFWGNQYPNSIPGSVYIESGNIEERGTGDNTEIVLKLNSSQGWNYVPGLIALWQNGIQLRSDEEIEVFSDNETGVPFTIDTSINFTVGSTIIRGGTGSLWTLTLPSNDGGSGQVLQTDGAGVTSWVNQSSGSGLWIEGTNGDYDNSDPVIVGADAAFDPDIPGTRGPGDLKATKLSVSDIFINNGDGIFTPTADGADNTWLAISGGGDIAGGGTYMENRGGFARFYGNENSTKPGRVEVTAGAVTNSMITLAKWDNTLSQRIIELDIDQTGATFFGQTGSDVVVAQGLDFWIGGTSAGVKITESATSPWTLTLPANDGASGQVLQTDGAGVTSWVNSVGGQYYVRKIAVTQQAFNVFCDPGDVAVDGTPVGTEDQWGLWYADAAGNALADRATNPNGVHFLDVNSTYVHVVCLDK